MKAAQTLLIAFTAFLMSAATAQAAAFTGSGGSGTVADPYLISSTEDMQELAAFTNGGGITSGVHFKVTTDINLGGEASPYPSIGVDGKVFKGDFDGGGHVISGLYGSPLFTSIGDGASLEHFLVQGEMHISKGSASGVCSSANGSGITITGVGSEVDIYSDGAGGSVGGICGNAKSTAGAAGIRITACWNTGDILLGGESGTASQVAGIVGQANSGCTVDSCYNTGKISACSHVSGIVGWRDEPGAGLCPITNCYNAGTIDDVPSSGGAIAGYGMASATTGNYYLDTSCPYGVAGTIRAGSTPLDRDGMQSKDTALALGPAYVYVEGSYPRLAAEYLIMGSPVIATQPVGATCNVGDSAAPLAVEAKLPEEGPGYDGKLSYQWYTNDSATAKGAVAIDGATYSTYALSTAENGGAYYYCIVTNTYTYDGESYAKPVTSNPVQFNVLSTKAAATPAIKVQPIGQDLDFGENPDMLELAAQVSGPGAGKLSYQWYSNTTGIADPAADAPIDGATSYTYQPTSTPGASYYYCVVTNNYYGAIRTASVTSDIVRIFLSDTIEISTAEQLAAFRDKVNSGTSYEGATVKLTADIDLSSICYKVDGTSANDKSWTPIGRVSAKRFAGTFDGGYHTISGLYINSTASAQALFGNISPITATIENLTVSGTVMTTSSTAAGVVATASDFGGGTIVDRIVFKNVCNEVDVSAKAAAAGVCGTMAFYNTQDGSSHGVFEGCCNSGAIIVTRTTGTARVGGIAFSVANSYGATYTFDSCYNTGSLQGRSFLGGIIGDGESSNLKECYSTGSITSTAATDSIGALAGSTIDSAESCYYLIGSATSAAANGSTPSGCMAMDESGMKTASFAAVLGRSYIANPNGYPKLAWQTGSDGTPVFVAQPQGAAVEQNEAVQLVAEATITASGAPASGTIAYQWYKNSTDSADGAEAIDGATGATYAPSTDTKGSTVYYFCMATNTFDNNGTKVSKSAVSSIAEVAVVTDVAAATPAFTAQPVAQSMEYGTSPAALSAQASVSGNGAGTLSYQWYSNASASVDGAAAIAGATAESYTPPANLGTTYYYCVATNTFEQIKKATATSDIVGVAVDDTVSIGTVDEFKAFRDKVNAGDGYYGVTVKLTADLDLNNEGWTPIASGTSGKYFYGTFDGQYHTISNFTITAQTGNATGLFGEIASGAIVENLTVSGAMSPTTGGNNTYSFGIVGTMDSASHSQSVPGPAGCIVRNVCSNEQYTINSCSTGGIVGRSLGTASAPNHIVACCATGGITISSSNAIAGGILGYASSNEGTIIESCYNTGHVGNYFSFAGGITGCGGTIVDCYMVGSAPTESNMVNQWGPIYGYYAQNSQSIAAQASNCYYLGASAFVGGLKQVGCTSATAAQMQATGFSAKLGSAFVDQPQSYPALAWQIAVPEITGQPKSASYSKGDSATALEITASVPAAPRPGADGTISYQWRSNATGIMDLSSDTVIAGATGSSYTPPTDTVGTAYYYCVVTNTPVSGTAVSIPSDVATVVVLSSTPDGVEITEQPSSISANQGASKTISVTASFAGGVDAQQGVIAYQWYRIDASGDVAVDGATDAKFTVPSSDMGKQSYYCIASNSISGIAFNSVKSDSATVTIDPALTITSADELAAFAETVNAGTTYMGYTIELAGDIDLSAYEDWTPIGTYASNDSGRVEHAFQGTFDGNGHAITHIKSSGLGLFGNIYNATLRNFSVTGESRGVINSPDSMGASLVCARARSSVFRNIAASGTLENEYGAGMICGWGNTCEFDHAYSSGTISISGTQWISYVGGIAGVANDSIFTDCENDADVSGYRILGGIVGQDGSDVISSCINTGNISARYANAGGIAGYTSGYDSETGCPITSCYNAGDIVAASGDAAGISAGTARVERCYNIGNITTGNESVFTSFDPISYKFASGSTKTNYYLEGCSSKANTVYEASKSADYMQSAAFLDDLGDAYKLGTTYPLLAWQSGEGFPKFSSQPKDVQFTQGQQAQPLSVAAIVPPAPLPGCDGVLSYQWYMGTSADGSDAKPIDGATDASCRLSTDMAPAYYYYYCIVTNSFDDAGTHIATPVKSATAKVTIVSTVDAKAPVIAAQPDSATYAKEAPEVAALSLDVEDAQGTGYGTLSYQWFSAESAGGANAKAIDGATGTSYTPSVALSGTTYYYCIITNTFENVKIATTQSDPARVFVYLPADALPVITAQPVEDAGTLSQGSIVDALSVTASLPAKSPFSSGKLSYQWYTNTTGKANPAVDSAIKGATAASYAPDTSVDVGYRYYYCVVTNTFGSAGKHSQSVNSSLAKAVIISDATASKPLVESVNMADASYTQGTSAQALSVAATATDPGAGVLSYQWYCSDDSDADPTADTLIADANRSSYTPQTKGYVGDKYYFCVVTNTFENVKTADAVSDCAKVTLAPYLTISTAQGLYDFGKAMESQSAIDGYNGLTVELSCDIDLSSICGADIGRNWDPIGRYQPFKGTFDGRGHTISGLYENGSLRYGGLFGQTSNAVIKNLVVSGSLNSKSTGTSINVSTGGIIAAASGTLTLENVGSEVAITSAGDYVGGLVGNGQNLTSATIENCYSKAPISTTMQYAGGIAGIINNATIRSCYNQGAISATGNLGGITGSTYDGPVTIEGCYSTGSIAPLASGGTNYGAINGAVGGNAAVTYSGNAWLASSTDRASGGVDDESNNTKVKADDMREAAFAQSLGDAYKAVEGSYPILSWESAIIVNPPIITVQPVGGTADQGSQFSLSITATMPSTASQPSDTDGVLSYQWYSNTDASTDGASKIDGATAPTYDPSTADGGTVFYYCVVSNTYEGVAATATSDIVEFSTITAVPAGTPSITVQPVDVDAFFGTDAPLLVKAQLPAEGAGVLSYQWYESLDGTNGMDTAEAIDGATSSSYSAPTTALGKSQYFCVVTNTFESTKSESVASNVASVKTVLVSRVKSAEDLALVSKAVSVGQTYAGQVVSLENDIDLSSVCGGVLGSWTPIGAYVNYQYKPFSGTFEGNGHTISNLYIDSTDQYQGLFGCLIGGTVRDLVVQGQVSSTQGTVGGVVAYADENSSIVNVGNEAAVRGANQTGGILGVGLNAATGTTQIISCYNAGDISDSKTWGNGFGGITGVGGYIEYCYNLGSVTGGSNYTGGISSASDGGKTRIVSCYNAGSVSVLSNPNSAAYIGPLAGYYNVYAGQEYKLTNCYYLKNACGYGDQSYSTEKTSAEMDNASFADLLNSGSSAFKAVDGAYPILAWQDGQSLSQSGWVISAIPDQTWTGIVVKPSISVLDENGNPVDSSLYTISYGNNIDSGDGATVMVSAADASGYYGSISATFSIVNESGDADVVDIYTPSDLKGLSDAVHAGHSYAGVTVRLMNDIDLSSICGKAFGSWQPIGYTTSTQFTSTVTNPFMGTFDGNGYTISGLYAVSEDGMPMGLFGCVENATIKDVVVSGSASLTPSQAFSGSAASPVAAIAYGSTLQNICNKAPVELKGISKQFPNNAGGVVGYASNCVIEGCVNTADITVGQYQCAGGVAGSINASTSVKSCYSTGNVSGAGTCGGLVYWANASNISACYSTGDVTGPDSDAKTRGAIVASSNGSTISGCFYDSDKATADAYVTAAAGGCSEADMAAAPFVKKLNDEGGEFEYCAGNAPRLSIADYFGAANITAQTEADQSYAKGATGVAAISVTAKAPEEPMKGNGGTLSYQWYSNSTGAANPAVDAAVEGATTNECTPSTATAGTTYYYCVIGNTKSPAVRVSAPVAVGVSDGAAATPEISVTPSKLSALEQVAPADSFVATATLGDGVKGEITYQWYSSANAENTGGTAIKGATEATYNPGAHGAVTTYYYCVASNEIGGVEFAPVASDAVEFKSTVTLTISTADELKAFASNVNTGTSYAGLTVALADDIDLSSVCSESLGSWTPIGTFTGQTYYTNYPFAGTFEGNGHTISGLYINSNNNYVGLFGYVNGGTVKDLVVSGSVKGANYAGGLVGAAYNCTIQQVGNEADVTASSNYAGGIAGVISYDGWYSPIKRDPSVASCYNTGSIHAIMYYAGGIAGSCNSTSMTTTSCYNLGSVSATSYACGIGQYGNYVSCYNAGAISSATTANGSPISPSYSNKTNCYYLLGCDGIKTPDSQNSQAKSAEYMASASFVADLGSDYKATDEYYPFLEWQKLGASISKGTLALDQTGAASTDAWTYSGSAIVPATIVTVGEGVSAKTLVAGTDYVASYADNSKAGTATVNVKGINGNYGTLSKTFSITGTDISDAVVGAIADQPYTGSAITPELTVTLGEGETAKTLAAGTDYTVSYSNNSKTGTATAAITGTGDTGYTGTKDATFNITKVALDDADNPALIDAIPAQNWTGAAIEPVPVVKVTIGGTVITVSPDEYDVSWSNNIDINDATGADKPTATVTAKTTGDNVDYTGSVTATFVIQTDDLGAVATISPIADQVWTGSEIKPAVELKVGNEVIDPSNYTVEYDNNVNAGKATVSVTATNGNAKYTGTKEGTFNIVGASISGATVGAIADQTFTGAEVKPQLDVSLGDVKLEENTDYTVAYADNVHAGTATATVKGAGNYQGTLAAVEFTIAKASLEGATINDIAEQIYSGKAIAPKPVVVLNGHVIAASEYTVGYSDNTNAGAAKVTVTAVDGSDFTSGTTASKEFTISKAEQAAPVGFVRGNVSIETLCDGAIYYVTDAMEYRAAGDEAYTPVAEGAMSVDGLGEGTYDIRYAADANHNASPDTAVILKAMQAASYKLSISDPQPASGLDDLVYGYTAGSSVTYTITNVGNVDVTGITAAAITTTEGADAFEAALPAKAELAPGETTTVVVNAKTALAAGDYEGTLTATSSGDETGVSIGLALKVAPADISTVLIDAIADQVYTGGAIAPEPALEFNGTTLSKGDDYTFSYTDADGIAVTPQTVGAYKAVVAGTGNFTGTTSIDFRIVKALTSWQRLAGEGRYDTMETIVKTGFDKADTVILATGANYPDALAASALAGVEDAPIVLTDPEELSSQAVATIEALGAKNVIVVGGTGAVSADVASQVQALGTKVTRVSGATRIDTALEIYGAGKGGWSDTCIVATAYGFADALSASPYAYAKKAPVFLAEKDGSLSEATLAAISGGGFKDIVIVGGTGAVSAKSAGMLAELGSVTRLGGANRYATSSLIADYAVKAGVLSYGNVAVATGNNFPDALAGSSMMGKMGGVLLLVSPDDETCIDGNISDNKDSVLEGYVLGGTGAVSNALMQDCQAATK